MKILCLLMLMIMFSNPSFSQNIDQDQRLTQNDFLKKSKNQKTAAWIATGVGTTIFAVTVFAAASIPPYPTYGEDEVESTGTVPAVIGLACIAAGGYLFFASARNKRKARAATVFLDIENAPMLQYTSINKQSFPVLGVRVCF